MAKLVRMFLDLGDGVTNTKQVELAHVTRSPEVVGWSWDLIIETEFFLLFASTLGGFLYALAFLVGVKMSS